MIQVETKNGTYINKTVEIYDNPPRPITGNITREGLAEIRRQHRERDDYNRTHPNRIEEDLPPRPITGNITRAGHAVIKENERRRLAYDGPKAKRWQDQYGRVYTLKFRSCEFTASLLRGQLGDKSTLDSGIDEFFNGEHEYTGFQLVTPENIKDPRRWTLEDVNNEYWTEKRLDDKVTDLQSDDKREFCGCRITQDEKEAYPPCYWTKYWEGTTDSWSAQVQGGAASYGLHQAKVMCTCNGNDAHCAKWKEIDPEITSF